MRLMNQNLRQFLTGAFSLLFFFAVNGVLSAQDKEEGEPIWVISWALFFAFLAIGILLLARPTKRRETLMNEEELKQYEEALGAKRAALIKNPEDDIEDDDD